MIAIPTEYVAKEYLEEPTLLNNTLFRAAITSWAVNSNYPDGILNGTIGQMGEIPIETQALLIDNGIHWTEKFSDEVMRCLPATVRHQLI